MRWRLLVLALTLLLGGVAQARDLRIALGVQDPALLNAPTDSRKGAAQTGGLLGFNEALAREICRRATARCTMSYLTFAEILPGVETGQYELGFGNFLRTPEREKRVDFSEPIWRSSSRLLARSTVASQLAGKSGEKPTLDSLQAVRIAVVEDTVQHRYLLDIPAERAISVRPLKTMADLITALREDKADLLFMPMLTSYALISREPAGSFEFVGPPIADRGLGGTVHIAITRQRGDVLLRVNQAIAAMRADGTYQRIVRQFFPFSLD